LIVIDDSYNANPTSMRAALDGLSRLTARRKIAVLGDMAELGVFSDQAHRDLGVYAAGLAIDVLYWFGENGGLVGEGLSSREAATVFESFRDRDKLSKSLADGAEPDDVILVKASRSCQLDKVVRGFLDAISERGDD
jgi:UDP-N-acetylmuramoyl-tripeptide--D-alanyl-D-alanine ligase